MFLSHNNDKKIPAVDNKTGGLIAIYLNRITGDFAEIVMSNVRVQSAYSIRSFLQDKFLSKVDMLMKYRHNLKRYSTQLFTMVPFLLDVLHLQPRLTSPTRTLLQPSVDNTYFSRDALMALLKVR